MDEDLIVRAHRAHEVDRHDVQTAAVIGAHSPLANHPDDAHGDALITAGDAVTVRRLAGGAGGVVAHSITLAFSSSSSCS
jgi:hypothetical protein